MNRKRSASGIFSIFCGVLLGACTGSIAGDSNESGNGANGEVDPPSSADDPAPVPRPSLESLRNQDPLFRRHENTSSAGLSELGFDHPDFTESGRADNGPQPGQGQFRLMCQWSHFGYDDPIVLPRQAGASHLHMFWGNTKTDAFTRFNAPSAPNDPNDIQEHGGSTCQAFELNRSAYWMPALLSDRRAPRSVIVPRAILLYYKSHKPEVVHPMPAGVQLLAGNVEQQARVGNRFDWNGQLFWACGSNGSEYNHQGQIPTNCNGGDMLNARISFPQCLQQDSGGNPVLTSDDFLSHTKMISPEDDCPNSHPYRIPQISYLIYWPNGNNGNGGGVENWVLSSDRLGDGGTPGGSLHGDWLGGWHDDAVQKWIDGCFDPTYDDNIDRDGDGMVEKYSGPRNCANGQTGQNRTGRIFRKVSNLNTYERESPADYQMPLPE